jgi:hypothetical protein
MATRKKAVARKGANLPANIDKQMEEEAKAIGSTITNVGSDQIKLDQENGAFFEIPGLGQAEPPMEVVVVDYISSNQFYIEAYDKNNIVPPDCWAIGKDVRSLAPDPARVTDPEAETCAECPNNEFGSKGAGKACQNRFLVAVIPPDAEDDEELRYLSISPTGLKSFSTFVSGVAARFKKPPVGAIVEVGIVKAGKGYTASFGKFKPNPNYREHYMRRDDAKPVLEAGFEAAPSGNVSPSRKAPRKKAPARRRAARR